MHRRNADAARRGTGGAEPDLIWSWLIRHCSEFAQSFDNDVRQESSIFDPRTFDGVFDEYIKTEFNAV